jgi:hypothetical protein
MLQVCRAAGALAAHYGGGCDGGMRPTDIAKALKIGRASVYRVLGQKVAN